MRKSLITSGVLAATLATASCGDDKTQNIATGLEFLSVTSAEPHVIVPGTLLIVEGASFLDQPLGLSSLRLVGTYGGAQIDTQIPAKFLDFDHLEVQMGTQSIGLLGANTGEFNGTMAASVLFAPDGSTHQSLPVPVTLSIHQELEPVLDSVDGDGTIFVNEKIEVRGSGLLFGGPEGTTVAMIEGCFTPADAAECLPIPPAEVDVTPSDSASRELGTFPFSPRIAGIFPGAFEGSVRLENRHAAGGVTSSSTASLNYEISPATLGDVGQGASLGQYIDMQGGGFIGGDDGLTILRLTGEYIPDDVVGAVPIPSLELIPEFVEGNLVRYLVNEQDELGQSVDLRSDTGSFDGFIRPIIRFGDDEYEGAETPVTFHLDNVKQVVWVKFNNSYVESLRKFGLRAMDSRIRARILTVLRRDYETINVDFREEEPTDYALYATIEIAGPDPNGLGLLGYDNTPGKDFNNERLFDSIGGVNAQTQEDGFPGFGGVFIESIFTYSPNPPSGGGAEVAVGIFDEIFDPFRPDRGGSAVSSSDFVGAGVPDLESGGSCPASDRRLQAACSVWVLGSVIGSTVSHELGHSLGLADPLGERFHNINDAPNRLMDQGGNRSFEERAELNGEGPSAFCVEAYQYLRGILPTDAAELVDGREHC